VFNHVFGPTSSGAKLHATAARSRAPSGMQVQMVRLKECAMQFLGGT